MPWLFLLCIGVGGNSYAWTDLPFPAAGENFYQPLVSGNTIITKSWQGNLLTGTGFDLLPAPLNNLTGGAQYRMAFLAPPGAARASISIGYANTLVFNLGAYNEKLEYYGASTPPQPDTDLQGSSAIASLRLYPIGNAFEENKEACAKTTYFLMDGSSSPSTQLVSVDLFLQFTNTAAYQRWLDNGKPVCGQTGTTGTTTTFNITVPTKSSPGQNFTVTTTGALLTCAP